jgi:hypothetical protein
MVTAPSGNRAKCAIATLAIKSELAKLDASKTGSREEPEYTRLVPSIPDDLVA